VVVHHLLEWPSGGFIGVDVFFVISGFLITGLLLREQERSGRISFRDFYRRRAKRILPAATIVIVASLLGGLFVYGRGRADVLLGDALAATLFVSNWRFAAESTDYFSQSGPESPFQQFWSLAVEEQFYLAWPVLIVAVFWLLRRGPLRRVPVRSALTGVLAVVLPRPSPGRCGRPRSSPHARTSAPSPARGSLASVPCWRCGARADPPAGNGAAPPGLDRTGLHDRIAVAGDTGLCLPCANSVLPVLGTALVIAAGTGTLRQPWLGPLTSRVSTYVGDISYSLYLWHWPFIVLGTAVWGRSGPVLAALAAVSLAAAAYSYHLVEDPIRRSDWLEPRARRESWRDRLTFSSGQRAGWTSLAVVLSLLVLVGLQRSVPDYPLLPTTAVVAGQDGADTPGGPEAVLQAQVVQALQASAYPELQPSMDEAVGAAQAPDEVQACGTKDLPIEECSWGPADAAKTAVVVGDSIAMTYVGSLRAALPDWRVVSLGGFGCTFTSPLIGNPDTELEAACPARKERALATISQLEPELVLLSHVQYPRQPVGASEALTEVEWSSETVRFFSEVADAVDVFAVVAPPPADKDVNECYTRVSEPADCVGVVTEQWETRADTERAMARALGGVWLDSSPWFCADGRCPPFVGSTPRGSTRRT
jgi:peptidoglycan/LPS O-acetylase OafA/YrhL